MLDMFDEMFQRMTTKNFILFPKKSNSKKLIPKKPINSKDPKNP